MEKIGNVEDVPSVDEVILGVDTHLDLHVAVALDQLGRRLGQTTVPTSTRGYARLLCWAEGFGVVGCVISLPAIVTHHAATLLCVAGDNPQPLASVASFASLCGV